jgi:hypothetical protein
MKLVIGLLTCCILLAGCDADRIAKLEKENAELKAKIEKQSLVADYDHQAKCAKDARSWFNENWSRGKNTIILDFTNHYNVKLNKCFILVEHHYNSHLASSGGDSWTNDMSITDVYENSTYAQFTENHYIYWKPKYSEGEEVITCSVGGATCKTGEEFNDLIRPHMND